jgi:hypothetical protein
MRPSTLGFGVDESLVGSRGSVSIDESEDLRVLCWCSGGGDNLEREERRSVLTMAR